MLKRLRSFLEQLKYLSIKKRIIIIIIGAIVVLPITIAETFAWQGMTSAMGIFMGKTEPSFVSNLEVSNIIENDDGDEVTEAQKDLEFTFEIVFSDGEMYSFRVGNGILQELKDGTFRLKHGEIAIFEDIPIGITYAITRRPHADYTVTSVGEHGTIHESDNKASFINMLGRKIAMGKLVIMKRVIIDEEAFAGNEPIDIYAEGVNVSDKPMDIGGESILATAGHMKTNDERVKVKAEPSETSAESTSIQISNSNIEIDLDKEFDFTITIGDDTHTHSIKDGETYEIDNIPVGTSYEVVENDYSGDGYVTTAKGSQGTIVAGENEVEFTNTFTILPFGEYGTLRLTKSVVGDNLDVDKEFLFRVTIGTNMSEDVMLKDGESVEFEDIPVGTMYRIVEENYSEENFVATSQGATGTIVMGTNEAIYTNTFNKGVPPQEETPEGSPGEMPGETPSEPPEEVPGETPNEPPGETPSEPPGETPSEPPEEAPGETPSEPPGEIPDETPSGAPNETPDKTSTDDNGFSEKVQTGDASKMLRFFLLAMISINVIIVVIRRKRKQKKV